MTLKIITEKWDAAKIAIAYISLNYFVQLTSMKCDYQLNHLTLLN